MSHSRVGVGYRLAVIVSEISMQISCCRGLRVPNMIKPHYHALPSGHASRPKRNITRTKFRPPHVKKQGWQAGQCWSATLFIRLGGGGGWTGVLTMLPAAPPNWLFNY
jgi:hypothetical protein